MDGIVISEVFVLVLLAVNSYTDIRRHEILPVSLALGTAAAVPLIALGYMETADAAGGLAVGVMLIIASMITKGAVGPGDGLMICVTGILLGVSDNLMLLTYALMLCAVVSGVRLLLRRVKRKDRCAFIPFLFLADIWRLIYKWLL